MTRAVQFLGEERIGFQCVSIDGAPTGFWWWKNAYGDPDGVKRFCGMILAKTGVEARLGPAVDVRASIDARRIITMDSGLGIYVEANKIEGFSLGPEIFGEQWVRVVRLESLRFPP